MGLGSMAGAIGTPQVKRDSKIKSSNFTEDIQGKRCGVDGSALIHKAFSKLTYEDRRDFAYRLHCKGAKFVMNEGLKDCISKTVGDYVSQLKGKHRAQLVVAFDGKKFVGKKGEDDKRAEEKRKAFDTAVKLEGLRDKLRDELVACRDKADEASQVNAARLVEKIKEVEIEIGSNFTQCLYRHPDVVAFAMHSFRQNNVSRVFLCPYEADQFLAFNALIGNLDVILVEDMDLVVYGCDTVVIGGIKMLYNDSGYLKVALVRWSSYWTEIRQSGKTTYDYRNWTTLDGKFDPAYFKMMACLSGCDYTKKETYPLLSGIGQQKAYTIVAKCVQLRANNPDDPSKQQLTYSDALLEALIEWCSNSGKKQQSQNHQNVTVQKAKSIHEVVMHGLACFNGQYVYDIATFEQRRFDPTWPLTAEQEATFGSPVEV